MGYSRSWNNVAKALDIICQLQRHRPIGEGRSGSYSHYQAGFGRPCRGIPGIREEHRCVRDIMLDKWADNGCMLNDDPCLRSRLICRSV